MGHRIVKDLISAHLHLVKFFSLGQSHSEQENEIRLLGCASQVGWTLLQSNGHTVAMIGVFGKEGDKSIGLPVFLSSELVVQKVRI